jgi:hypothetical protein
MLLLDRKHVLEEWSIAVDNVNLPPPAPGLVDVASNDPVIVTNFLVACVEAIITLESYVAIESPFRLMWPKSVMSPVPDDDKILPFPMSRTDYTPLERCQQGMKTP